MGVGEDKMYYRLGERVRIEKKLRGKPDVWGDITGRIAHIKTPRTDSRFRFSYGFGWMYGIELDEPDVFGKTKIVFYTNKPQEPHSRITRLGNPKLHPKFLNYRKFIFSKKKSV